MVNNNSKPRRSVVCCHRLFITQQQTQFLLFDFVSISPPERLLFLSNSYSLPVFAVDIFQLRHCPEIGFQKSATPSLLLISHFKVFKENIKHTGHNQKYKIKTANN